MTREERSLLEGIDKMLLAEEVRAQIQPVVERVRAQLQRKTTTVMAWEPIPLSIYRDALPAMIRSSWVFILRAGTNTGAERHPNSHQRMMSFEGSGDMQVGDDEQDVGCRKSDVGRRDSMAVECFGERSRRATGAKMDFYPRECLASAGRFERGRLGSRLVSHGSGRGTDRRTAD